MDVYLSSFLSLSFLSSLSSTQTDTHMHKAARYIPESLSEIRILESVGYLKLP